MINWLNVSLSESLDAGDPQLKLLETAAVFSLFQRNEVGSFMTVLYTSYPMQ